MREKNFQIKGYSYVGSINIGDRATISDPCYDSIQPMCNCRANAESGEYDCYLQKKPCSYTYKGKKKKYSVVSRLVVVHKDYKFTNNDFDKLEYLYSCAVDSGTCGVFDTKYYEETHDDPQIKEEWYEDKVIGRTEENSTICDDRGIYSHSGHGDGLYNVYTDTGESNQTNHIFYIVYA